MSAGPPPSRASGLNRREVVGVWPEIAFQYYVLARVAMRSGYWYPAAYCSHFALELMIKYMLVLPKPWNGQPWPNRAKVFTVEEVPHHHDLTRLWRTFSESYPGNSLSEFEPLIREMGKWNPLRYAQLRPEGVTVFTRTLEQAAASRLANAEQPHDAFALDIGELDRLFRALLDFCNITPSLRGAKFMVYEGREAYEFENDHAIL